MDRRIEHKAARGQFVTLDQLAAFVQEAMRAGADGATVVEGTVSFGGKLQRVALKINDVAPKEK
jgi:PII-like signaling protein